MIELSVRLPLFRAKYIAWLPFEGLIRQKNINFEWELIIAEEVNDTEVFGIENISKYKESLNKVGCVRIVYIPLLKWIPLGTKIGLIIQHTSPTSRISVENSGDYYSAPQRLFHHYEVFKNENVDHHLASKSIHYSIIEDKAILIDKKYRNTRGIHDVVGRATKMEIMRKLPRRGPLRGVDAWLFLNMQYICEKMNKEFIIIPNTTDDWKYSLSVTGLNNLSSKILPSCTNDGYITEYTIEEIQKNIPLRVFSRLQNSYIYLEKHMYFQPQIRNIKENYNIVDFTYTGD